MTAECKYERVVLGEIRKEACKMASKEIYSSSPMTLDTTLEMTSDQE